MISIIIPVLNEKENLKALLMPLQKWRQHGHEIILVEGGGDEQSERLSKRLVDVFIHASPGRARQMNAGAAMAKGSDLLFLHADTRLPAGAEQALLQFSQIESAQWGFFDLRLAGRPGIFRVIETMINWRSSLTCIATGDQAIFVRNSVFRALQGYADIPLMEDVEICRRLKKRTRPIIVPMAVLTASRRWEVNGVIKTILLMWLLRLSYYLGVSPQRLVRAYYPDTDYS